VDPTGYHWLHRFDLAAVRDPRPATIRRPPWDETWEDAVDKKTCLKGDHTIPQNWKKLAYYYIFIEI